ncbi:MAG: zinc ABC transporter substrate-binding protein [Patescibacteria group bacterium]
MKKSIFPSLIFILMLAGCGAQTASESQKINIVASFYPWYEIAVRVGGDLVKVTNLTPAGAEPHDYEPTPQDIIALKKARLVIFNGAGLEPWAEKLIPQLEKDGATTFNASQNFGDLLHSTDSQENYSGLDPHLWLDPLSYKDAVQMVTQKLASLDPAQKGVYEKNAQKYMQEIDGVHADFERGLKVCKFRSFVTNHAAFAYLARRYNLTMVPIAGLSPDAEPSPRELANLATDVKKLGVKYILVETLVSPKVAEVLAKEVGAQTLELNPLEGLTPEQISDGKNYISVMKENLEHLKTALECP